MMINDLLQSWNGLFMEEITGQEMFMANVGCLGQFQNRHKQRDLITGSIGSKHVGQHRKRKEMLEVGAG